MPPLPSEVLRPHASRGAAGLLKTGLGLLPEDEGFEEARAALLMHYEQHLTTHVRFFPGIESLLAALDAEGLPWGIITNKHERFTLPLLHHLGLDRRAACVVAGDTTPQSKPHPLPLLHAASQIPAEPIRCLYIGDDRRDIDAARAACYGCAIAVRWGYLGDTPVETWGSDHIVENAEQLRQAIQAFTRNSGGLNS